MALKTVPVCDVCGTFGPDKLISEYRIVTDENEFRAHLCDQDAKPLLAVFDQLPPDAKRARRSRRTSPPDVGLTDIPHSPAASTVAIPPVGGSDERGPARDPGFPL